MTDTGNQSTLRLKTAPFFFPTPPHFFQEITSLLPRPWDRRGCTIGSQNQAHDLVLAQFTWPLTQNGKASSWWGRIHCGWGASQMKLKETGLFPRGRWANRAPNDRLPHSLGKAVSNRQAAGSCFPGLTAWIQTPGAFHQHTTMALLCLYLLTKFKLDSGHDQPEYPNTAYWCQVAQIIRWNERKKKKSLIFASMGISQMNYKYFVPWPCTMIIERLGSRLAKRVYPHKQVCLGRLTL